MASRGGHQQYGRGGHDMPMHAMGRANAFVGAAPPDGGAAWREHGGNGANRGPDDRRRMGDPEDDDWITPEPYAKTMHVMSHEGHPRTWVLAYALLLAAVIADLIVDSIALARQ